MGKLGDMGVKMVWVVLVRKWVGGGREGRLDRGMVYYMSLEGEGIEPIQMGI